jgi:hypothetical protein
MAAHVDGIVGDHHYVECAGRDEVVTTRAEVLLHRLVRLDRSNCYPEIAHATSANVTTMATTTRTMSNAVLRCSLNGLKPTG